MLIENIKYAHGLVPAKVEVECWVAPVVTGSPSLSTYMAEEPLGSGNTTGVTLVDDTVVPFSW